MTEKEIIEEEIGLSWTEFNILFGDIKLSEIIKYYNNSPLTFEHTNGICFFGKDINLEVSK